MDSKLSPRILIEESLKGNFEDVLAKITSNRPKIEMGSALKVVIAICNACHANMSTPNQINETEMVKLLKLMLRLIHKPNGDQFMTYLHSVIYILKFLHEKRSYDCIVDLESLFIPDFIPLTPAENHQTIYLNICKIINNTIVKIVHSKEQKNTQLALKLSYLLSRIYKTTVKKPSLFEWTHKCVLSLIILNITPQELANFHCFTIKLLDTPDNSLYPGIINNLSVVFAHLIKQNETDWAEICFNKTSAHLSQTYKSREYSWLSSIMGVANKIPMQSTGAHSALKLYHAHYGSTPNLQSVCELISSAAYASWQVFKKSGSWDQKVDSHLDFYNFLYSVSVIMSETRYSSSCCSVRTNLHEATRTLDVVGGLGRLCILKVEVSRSYKLEVFRFLEKLVDFVGRLKEAGCPKWVTYWYNCGVHLSAIGMQFFKKDTEMLVLYLQKFVKIHLELEGFEPKVIEKVYLNTALNDIAESYFESHDYKKCLFLSAFALIFSESRKVEITRWIRAKAAIREKSIEQNLELQELTLTSIFEKHPEELRGYLPQNGLKLPKKKQIDLLIYELRQYQAKWKSKIPMSATFRTLSILAEPQLAAEVFIEIWGDGDLQVHETVPILLRDTIRRLKTETFERKDLLLGHLHFLQHKYQVKETIKKNCDDMEKTLNLTRTVEIRNGVPVDLDSNCDLVSSYESLRLAHYTRMMRHLDKSLEMTHAWLLRHQPESRDRQRLFKLLSNIGSEYFLQGNSTKTLQAWELSLKIAESDLEKLQVSRYLLEVSHQLTPRLEVPETNLDVLKTQHLEDVIAYLISKAEAQFRDFSPSYSTFLRAFDLSQNGPINDVLSARLHLLHHKFIMLPCQYDVMGHREISLAKIHEAVNKIRLHYTLSSNFSSYDMKMFLDIHETVVKMYHELQMPLDVRCYAKEGVIMAQKLVLPLRTNTFLFYLAHADVLTLQLDDCRVKLKDFSDILGVTSGCRIGSPIPEPEKQKEVDFLVQDFKEMMLDARIREPQSGSPTFVSEDFKKAPFMSHEDECECFYCTTWEYQEFVLKNAYLYALLHQYDGNNSLSESFFNGCLKIYKFLDLRQKIFTKKVSKRVSQEFSPNLRDKLFETYLYILLEYANFRLRNGRLLDAKTINTRALMILESGNSSYPYLYYQVMAQNLTILIDGEVRTPSPVMLRPAPDSACMKTPLPSRSKPVVSPQRLNSVKNVKISSKVLIFGSSDEEEEELKAKGTSLPEFLRPVSTPAPFKGRIKTRGKVLEEIPPFKATNSEFCTPKEKIDYLAQRTKLLTEKLKSSSKKSADENAGSSGRKNVRMNLMSQMEPAEGSGAVRRSTRNKR